MAEASEDAAAGSALRPAADADRRLSFAAVQPAAAQSILRDAETEALLRDMSRPLIEAAGLEPGQRPGSS